ncbi:hypothetical protein CJF30_00004653 [Rutstroemia sp. NJR-2017a BBW]|nr:hypothetical protein CJF30_00004653 [Rutstroemia sp. NJR-2017a BBW]
MTLFGSLGFLREWTTGYAHVDPRIGELSYTPLLSSHTYDIYAIPSHPVRENSEGKRLYARFLTCLCQEILTKNDA